MKSNINTKRKKNWQKDEQIKRDNKRQTNEESIDGNWEWVTIREWKMYYEKRETEQSKPSRFLLHYLDINIFCFKLLILYFYENINISTKCIPLLSGILSMPAFHFWFQACWLKTNWSNWRAHVTTIPLPIWQTTFVSIFYDYHKLFHNADFHHCVLR